MAYALRGAKTPLLYSLEYLFVLILFLNALKSAQTLNVSKGVLTVLLAFSLLTCLPLIQAPPLSTHLMSQSKIVLAFMFGFLVLASPSSEIKTILGSTAVVLSFIEAVLVFWHYPLQRSMGGYLEGNPTYSAMLISVGFLWILTKVTLEELKLKETLLWGGGLLVLLTGFFFCQSRTAFIGLSVASLVFLRKHRNNRAVFATLGMLSAVLLFSLVSGNYFIKIDWAHWADAIGRLTIWKTALLAIRARWLTGYGMGNFEAAYRLHQLPTLHVLHYSRTTIFAHNDYLQLAVVSGLFPATLLILFYIKLLTKAGVPARLDGQSRWAYSVIIFFGVAALFNFTVYLPFLLLLLSGATGMLLKSAGATDSPFTMTPYQRYGFGLVALLFGFFLLLKGGAAAAQQKGHDDLATRLLPVDSDLWYQKALHNIRSVPGKEGLSSSPETVIQDLRIALKWDKKNPFIWARLALVLFSTHPNQRKDIQYAFDRSLQYGPHHAPFFIQDGFTSLALREWARSKARFQKASELEPFSPVPPFGLGILWRRQGKKEKALESFRRAKDLYDRYHYLSKESDYAKYLFSIDGEYLDSLIRNLARARS